MLRTRGLTKTYGETHALSGLDVDAPSGSILGIAGPNGAGKSTFIRILAGEETADSGEVTFNDAPLSDSTEFQVAVVHQEPQLFLNLTVEANLLVGHEGTRARWPRSSDNIAALLADFELSEFRDRPLGTLPLAVQQRTEIARAVLRSAQLFLFDEPNSALTEEESEHLFVWMHRLAERGAAVLFITHRLSELVQHADSVVVIRDGRATDLLTEGFTQEDIAKALVGGETGAAARADQTVVARQVVRLVDWRSRQGRFAVPELELSRGEVVAVVGVEGSGGREFVASLAGYEPVRGRLELDTGTKTPPQLRREAQYLPASRRASLFSNLSLAQNVVARLGCGAIATRLGFMRTRQVRRLGEEARGKYSIASRSSDQAVGSLSGGNQQKVAIAATLASSPTVVAVEEPTRGVDVGSRAEIHRVLRDYARGGALVATFCTEVSEVFQLADRVFVMDAGSLSPALDVSGYQSAPSLAADISALERHAR
jgi:ABC-type sugar transport system ATPase subunit